MRNNIAPNFLEPLSALYGEREARSILRLYSEEKGELSEVDFKRLMDSEPIQYIIGTGHFYGREFNVNSFTLIPRGETEELVQRVIRSLGDDFGGTILDVGTGSGAIAVTLAAELKNAKVSAIDFSKGAIEVAESNAAKFGAEVDFSVQDLFDAGNFEHDVVVSNPPYVTQSEKKLMHSNVLEFEPDTALFVEDCDPLVFYREIARRTKNLLFFEINEMFGAQMKEMLESEGFEQIEVIKDIHDRDRICTAKRKR